MSPTAADLLWVDLLHRAGQCAERTFERHLGRIGVTARQYAILRAVATAQDLSQTQIQSLTGIDRSTTADMIRRMCRKGWLRRRRSSSDARRYVVRLTAEGGQLLHSVAQPARQTNEEIQNAITSLRSDQVRAALVELIVTLEAGGLES
jgi:MarR family transcriptional regulator, temperature-dependent positive regulator of motility